MDLSKIINLFGFEIELMWLIVAGAILAGIILVLIIIAAVNASKKKKAAKIAAYEAEVRLKAEMQAKEDEEKARKRAAERAAADAEAERIAKEQEAAAKKMKAAEARKAKAAEEKAAAEAAEKAAAEEEAKKQAEAEAKKKAAAEKRKKTLEEKKAAEAKAKQEAEEKAAAEEAARIAAEEEAKKRAEEEAKAAEAKEEPVAEAPAAEESAPVEKTKKAPAKKAEKPATKGSRYSGKWVVYKLVTEGMDEEDMYFFELHASNGEKLLSSEEYTSQQGALRGIETHKANIEKGNFRVGLSKKGDYIFKLLNGKNTLLCTGANYPTKIRCESAVESVKRFAATAVVDEKVQEIVLKAGAEDDFTETVEQVNEDYVGKWIISVNKAEDSDEKAYYFELFANNGEKLLSSEEYSSYVGAVNGIETHKTNIKKGNFRITLTKRGDYIFKLLNGNGQLLCLGEHYKSKARCESAVESVKRFALNAPVLTDSDEVKA